MTGQRKEKSMNDSWWYSAIFIDESLVQSSFERLYPVTDGIRCINPWLNISPNLTNPTVEMEEGL